jgi:hypothetical protein
MNLNFDSLVNKILRESLAQGSITSTSVKPAPPVTPTTSSNIKKPLINGQEETPLSDEEKQQQEQKPLPTNQIQNIKPSPSEIQNQEIENSEDNDLTKIQDEISKQSENQEDFLKKLLVTLTSLQQNNQNI